MNINRVLLGGNLTRKPEMSTTKGGTTSCKFSLAYNEIRKGGEKSTSYFNIVCYGKTAENCGKYLDKGSCVLVEGKLSSRTYKAEDGTNRTITEIYPTSVNFLSRIKSEKGEESQPDQSESEY